MNELHDPQQLANRLGWWVGMIILCGALAILCLNVAHSDRMMP